MDNIQSIMMPWGMPTLPQPHQVGQGLVGHTCTCIHGTDHVHKPSAGVCIRDYVTWHENPWKRFLSVVLKIYNWLRIHMYILEVFIYESFSSFIWSERSLEGSGLGRPDQFCRGMLYLVFLYKWYINSFILIRLLIGQLGPIWVSPAW